MKSLVPGRACIPAILLLLGVSTQAQYLPVTTSFERNPDNSYSIYADSRLYGEYTLQLTFNDMSGFKVSGLSIPGYKTGYTTMYRGKKEIARLTVDKMAGHIDMRFGIHWHPGAALNKPPADSNFLYLVPVGREHAVRVTQANFLEERLGATTITRPAGFAYQLGDTICAARAGIVYTTNDEVKEGETKNEVYRSSRNAINIQHRDGSLGHYTFRAPIHLLVEEGDEVMPGQPLAYFDKPSELYITMFSVNYLDAKKMVDNVTQGKTTSPYTQLRINFCTDADGTQAHPLTVNTTIVAKHPSKLIAQELTKKEKKKLGL